jgi:hypothetical protein
MRVHLQAATQTLAVPMPAALQPLRPGADRRRSTEVGPP